MDNSTRQYRIILSISDKITNEEEIDLGQL